MGNGFRTRYGIKIDILTESQVYRPGDTIRGIVYVEAKQNYVAQTIHLRILGEQRCQWVRGSSHNQHRQSNYNLFFKAQHVLGTFKNNHFQQGHYAWPFQMELPNNLPGSLSCRRFEDTEIRYTLSSFLVQYDNPSSLVQTSRQIKLIEPFRLTLSPVQGSDYCQPVNCFCRYIGQVGIHVNISKNVCLSDQSITIGVATDNQKSLSDVSNIVVELVQNVFMDASVEQRTFRKILKSHKLEGVEAGGRKKQFFQFKIDDSVIDEGTSLGEILANYYTIQIKPVMSKMLTFDVPSVVSPLFILKKLGQKQQKVVQFDSSTKFEEMQRVEMPIYRLSNNSSIRLMNNDVFPEEILQ